MCGIYGFISPKILSDPSFTEWLIVSMGERISFRGPDGSGFWHDGEILALGHRRLSIIDVSDAGSQPMKCATGRYVVTFNGEIYNYEALRRELESSGNAPSWRGYSDTEVLLAGFNAWGIKQTLTRCIGMFAIAVYDGYERKLILARDRMGEKPLYYGWQGKGADRSFVFASDLSAMKPHPSFEGEISPDAVSLLLRYNTIPAPFSIYKGIHKLEPGSILTIDVLSGNYGFDTF
jgi:asparagine synthase (glutamine-hydrolysing)